MNRKIVSVICVTLALITATLWATSRAGSTNRQLNRMNLPKEAGIDSGTNLTTDELVEESAVIATGRCIETHSSWVGRNLFTFATISVTETLKGQPGQTVTVAIPGGVDMNRQYPVAMRFPGAPEFYPQEVVFLFLKPATTVPGFVVTGVSQGKFSIVDDDQGHKIVSSGSVKVLRGLGSKREGGAKHPLRLEEFKEKVKRQIDLQ